MWHIRFGHQNAESLKNMSKNDLVYGLEKVNGEISQCDTCIKAKMTRAEFKSCPRSTTEPLQLIHMDLWENTAGLSFGGAKYLLTIVDDFSRYAHVYALKKKSECFDYFRRFKAQAENEMNRKIKAVRSDNGLEFCSKEFEDCLINMGIRMERTNAYSPEMNGVAERLNRTMAEGVRSLMIEAELPKGLWAELATSFIYLKNRFPHRSINNEIPYTLWYGRKCSARHLKVIGSLAYVYVEKHQRDKLDPKAKTGVLVGYALRTKGYRIWFPKERTVKETKHVKFNELIKGYKQSPLISRNTYVPDTFEEETQDCIPDVPVEETRVPVQSEPLHCRDINWERKEVQRQTGETAGKWDVYYYPPSATNPRLRSHNDVKKYCKDNDIIFDYTHFNFKPEDNVQDADATYLEVYSSNLVEPSTYEQAIVHPNAEEWHEAMQDELTTLEERNVFDIVERPQNRKTIGCRWVYKMKKDNLNNVKRYRARLVAQGYRQTPGIDFFDTFSPVINFVLIIMFFSLLVIGSNWVHKHIDIKCAYLYGNLNEQIYMEIPKGYKLDSKFNRNNHVMLLKKALYGLHQSGREWFLELDKTLTNLGFNKILRCNCIYVYNWSTIILVYVDDLVIFSKSNEDMEIAINLIQSKFDIKDLGKIQKAKHLKIYLLSAVTSLFHKV